MDINVSAKEFEKLSKYKDVQIKVERMWQLKTLIIPIVVGALGLVKKGTAKHLEKIPGKQNLAEIQKVVLTNAAHMLRSVINISYSKKRSAQNKNPKTKKNNRSMLKISFPVASGFG